MYASRMTLCRSEILFCFFKIFSNSALSINKPGNHTQQDITPPCHPPCYQEKKGPAARPFQPQVTWHLIALTIFQATSSTIITSSSNNINPAPHPPPPPLPAATLEIDLHKLPKHSLQRNTIAQPLNPKVLILHPIVTQTSILRDIPPPIAIPSLHPNQKRTSTT
ncbi:Uncharacterized protein TCM_019218 [Theobroma cacao]|uniref:Uncharacterized protein n=1 Tax=Theobroma cacao TaxID=3641 RepID=A0A061EG41_THECC|nr:Uncharacterized protein TCM_019218 [Theobroma cacao]